jgi:hypothetical protein
MPGITLRPSVDSPGPPSLIKRPRHVHGYLGGPMRGLNRPKGIAFDIADLLRARFHDLP